MAIFVKNSHHNACYGANLWGESMAEFTLYNADCLDVMRGMEPNTIDTIITDPPYGLSFMGKEWDHGVPGVPFWQAALHVAKPGAMLFAFGGTRTQHRLTVAIEDAGWEIRDVIMWVYGSGFPKSHNISKGIDNAAGAVREVVGVKIGTGKQNPQWNGTAQGRKENSLKPFYDDTTPATDAAKLWDGWGTALKPAWEPIIVAMKPTDGTFADNAQTWGVAGLWIDGGRVETDWETDPNKRGWQGGNHSADYEGGSTSILSSVMVAGAKRVSFPNSQGRFPANLIHDGSAEVTALFPETMADDGNVSAARFFYCAKSSTSERNEGLDGTRTVKYNIDKSKFILTGGLSWENVYTELVRSLQKVTLEKTVKWHIGESGESITGQCPRGSLSTILTAISKITTLEILNLLTPLLTSGFIPAVNLEMGNGGNLAENAGNSNPSKLNTMNESPAALVPGVSLVVSQMLSTISDGANWKITTNIHSTVKPLSLMDYLCTLTKTPTGGVVLDPFMGSGSTGAACMRTGRNFKGIDLNPEYVAIAEARIKHWAALSSAEWTAQPIQVTPQPGGFSDLPLFAEATP